MKWEHSMEGYFLLCLTRNQSSKKHKIKFGVKPHKIAVFFVFRFAELRLTEESRGRNNSDNNTNSEENCR